MGLNHKPKPYSLNQCLHLDTRVSSDWTNFALSTKKEEKKIKLLLGLLELGIHLDKRLDKFRFVAENRLGHASVQRTLFGVGLEFRVRV